METSVSETVERRDTAAPKLVVVDLASVFPDWDGPIPPSELIARSTLVKTLAEARRDDDVYLVGSSLNMAWAASEVFAGSAVIIESDDPSIDKQLSGQFLDYEETGIFGELVVVSSERRFLDVIQMFQSSGRSVRVLTSWSTCDVVLSGEADLTVFFPDFADEQLEAG